MTQTTAKVMANVHQSTARKSGGSGVEGGAVAAAGPALEAEVDATAAEVLGAVAGAGPGDGDGDF
jgi:hypothetical protein